MYIRYCILPLLPFPTPLLLYLFALSPPWLPGPKHGPRSEAAGDSPLQGGSLQQEEAQNGFLQPRESGGLRVHLRCVHTCVCCLCLHVCVYVCVCMVNVCVHVCVCMCSGWVCVHVCVFVCTHAHVCSGWVLYFISAVLTLELCMYVLPIPYIRATYVSSVL